MQLASSDHSGCDEKRLLLSALRRMRLGQLVLLLTVVLLGSGDGVGAAKGDRRSLLTFEDVEDRRKSSTAAVATARGRSVTTTTTNGSGGGTVTVTTYNNNGLWQRIKRCWKKIVGREERLRPAGASGGQGARAGAGGVVIISDDDNGGGTVTVTVFNNNGLFQRIKRWWKRIFAREASRSARRLRRLTAA
ncbi:hypothetical protein PHYPSEUDO_006425 [Phytophthora pseudosyringae]|uniref:RxLR effector protein n=1 Tax=Phytophthora pseudosyringae TaxID=221518 RepID=A0A8T1VP50_9STRA|nr:hypothetical protein PHYPSEUDO_006425 [Phytophthora pseudosyringae]